jgi:hypothetical protein
MRRICTAVGLAAIGAALVCGSAIAKSAPAFLPIRDVRIPVPHGVQPWLPTWVDHGREILFQNQVNGTTWITSRTGAHTHCISCSFSDRPKIAGGFTYAFPDNRRILVSHEIGALGGGDNPSNADAYVLQCTPSIWRCAHHRYLPVDMSADKGAELIVQRRTWHLSPDGKYLGWTDLRLDGMFMVVARLQRERDRYVAADPRIVDPPGPAGASDTNPTAWENFSQMYELKSFADGGRSILALAEPNLDPDVIKIDLRTGRVTRLTSNPDWDEDGALSPDGSLEALYSWRTRNRIAATGWIPQIPDFLGLDASAAIAPYYVSTWPGFQCDLSPWLLPGTGDDGGRLVGQPLQTYSGNLTPGNNLSGQQFWNPTSNAVLLQERLRTRPGRSANEQVAQKGLAPSDIAVAEIDRPATRPQRAVSSAVGAWAPAAATYQGPLAADRHVVVPGPRGGTATLTYTGNLSGGGMSVTFDHWTADGHTFVTGTMSAGNPAETTAPWTIRDDVTVSGAHTGRLRADLVINNNHHPLPRMTGSFSAVYDGHRAPPLAHLGACPAELPRATPLQATAHVHGNRVTVRVWADIDGDRRPVVRALVRGGTRRVSTNAAGRATLTLAHGRGAVRSVGRRHTVVVSAGDTFSSVKLRVR